MKSGKHALIEKPLATTVDDARRIIEAQKRSGCVAAVDLMQRFNPLIESLTALTLRKVLGELRRVCIENYAQDAALPPEHWFWNKNISGGILIEHGVHFIDLVNSLTDQKPIQVTGATFSRNRIQEDQAMANVLYERGLMATHYHSFSRPGYFEYTSIRFSYDLGQIDLYGWTSLRGRLTALVNSETRRALGAIPGFLIEQVRGVDDIR